MVQTHNRFKLFSAVYSNGAGLPPLLREIEKWVATSKVAPKSIGVEYLEGSGTLIMSLGYRDDEAYSIALQSVQLGKLDLAAGFAKTEKAIADQVAKLQNIICHELFVTESGDLNMIFMLQR
jgi:hypothetical protein